MRTDKATQGRTGTRRDDPDPAFVNTETAGQLLGETGRTFRRRWDPEATRNGGWIFHHGDVRYVIPNCPKGTVRRVPVAHIHAIRDGRIEATA